jgi:hypothetical protein
VIEKIKNEGKTSSQSKGNFHLYNFTGEILIAKGSILRSLLRNKVLRCEAGEFN